MPGTGTPVTSRGLDRPRTGCRRGALPGAGSSASQPTPARSSWTSRQPFQAKGSLLSTRTRGVGSARSARSCGYTSHTASGGSTAAICSPSASKASSGSAGSVTSAGDIAVQDPGMVLAAFGVGVRVTDQHAPPERIEPQPPRAGLGGVRGRPGRVGHRRVGEHRLQRVARRDRYAQRRERVDERLGPVGGAAIGRARPGRPEPGRPDLPFLS